MKNLKFLFTTLLLLCGIVVSAHDFEVGGIYYNITDATNNTVEVTFRGKYNDSYSNEYTGSVVIPESVTYGGTTYSVTSIGSRAFDDCEELLNVTIPNSIVSIDKLAFSGTSLWKNQPDGLVYIDNWLVGYKGSKPEGDIVIHDGARGICEAAFKGCSNITSVIIGNSVVTIGESAFYGCSALTSIEIPNSVTKINNYAFADCTNLLSVKIGDGVKSIGSYAFGFCKNITNLIIGRDFENMASYAFWECNAIEKLEFNCKTIDGWFNYEASIKEVVLGDNVECVMDWTFSDCINLERVQFGNSVKSIGSRAFYGCKSLVDIQLPNSVKIIGDNAFNGCTSLVNINLGNGIETLGNYMFSDCESLGNIEIPNTVKSIGDCVFFDCVGITSITIPGSVEEIGWSPFVGCVNLKDLTFNARNVVDNAFSGCSGLVTVKFSDDVKNIGFAAFNSCTSLKNIVLGNGVENIGNSAFSNCSNLESITINEKVVSIGTSVFYGCSSLKKITSLVPVDKLSGIDPAAFFGISDCVIYVPSGAKDWYSSINTWNNFSSIVELNEAAIYEVEAVELKNKDTIIYDLNGREIEYITGSGIYLIDGKKVMIK